TLNDEETDPHKFPDYDGFVSRTHCGKICAEGEGKPAYQTLKPELDMLGRIGGRNLTGEIVEWLENE
ncbi:MAG: hypothetical protein HKN23_18190, partial [Verrucomicrobiales bacterium]|nr:hypothetical protein [Verrucomicrobiales bacterium]